MDDWMMDLIMDLCGMSCISWLFRLAEGGGFIPVLISCQLRELIHLASLQDSYVCHACLCAPFLPGFDTHKKPPGSYLRFVKYISNAEFE